MSANCPNPPGVEFIMRRGIQFQAVGFGEQIEFGIIGEQLPAVSPGRGAEKSVSKIWTVARVYACDSDVGNLIQRDASIHIDLIHNPGRVNQTRCPKRRIWRLRLWIKLCLGRALGQYMYACSAKQSMRLIGTRKISEGMSQTPRDEYSLGRSMWRASPPPFLREFGDGFGAGATVNEPGFAPPTLPRASEFGRKLSLGGFASYGGSLSSFMKYRYSFKV